jgi:hypothetical protein
VSQTGEWQWEPNSSSYEERCVEPSSYQYRAAHAAGSVQLTCEVPLRRFQISPTVSERIEQNKTTYSV